MSTTYYGALPDSFTIDSDANYTIFIELSPGTAKMMPNLSVGYNSSGGNGLLAESCSAVRDCQLQNHFEN